MQDTQLRWMIGLSILVLVLVGLLAIEPSADGEGESLEVLVFADVNDVRAVSVVRTADTVDLTRVEDGWVLEGEGGGLADEAVVDRLLDDLREGARGEVLEDPAALAEYGLDPALARVELTLADGSTRTATYGDAAPTGWRTYVLGPEGQVLTVSSKPGELLSQGRSQFLDRRVLRLDPARVRRVILEGPEGRLEVYGEERHWWLDGFTRADSDAVDDLIMGLLDLRFDQVMTSLDPIDQPIRRATLVLEDGTRTVLNVGEGTPMGTLVEGPFAIGMVYPPTLALIGQGPTDVGDARAVPLDAMRDDRLVIRNDTLRWSAIRQATGWQAETSGEDVGQAIRGLIQLGIRYQPQPVAPATGVTFTVEVWRGDEVVTVDFGPGEPGWYVGKDQRGGEAYLVTEVLGAQLGALLGG